MLNDILKPDQIQWQPSTDQTLYQSLTFLPNSTFNRLMRGFHRTFATGVACWQGTLTQPDTWSRPIWDLYMLYLLRSFSRTCHNFFRTIHFKHPSVLSRFCFLSLTGNLRVINRKFFQKQRGSSKSLVVKLINIVLIFTLYYLLLIIVCLPSGQYTFHPLSPSLDALQHRGQTRSRPHSSCLIINPPQSTDLAQSIAHSPSVKAILGVKPFSDILQLDNEWWYNLTLVYPSIPDATVFKIYEVKTSCNTDCFKFSILVLIVLISQLWFREGKVYFISVFG